ncbi:MAG: dksA [Polaromonas sp.]|nr:dksA [Polaromonas sp.]
MKAPAKKTVKPAKATATVASKPKTAAKPLAKPTKAAEKPAKAAVRTTADTAVKSAKAAVPGKAAVSAKAAKSGKPQPTVKPSPKGSLSKSSAGTAGAAKTSVNAPANAPLKAKAANTVKAPAGAPAKAPVPATAKKAVVKGTPGPAEKTIKPVKTAQAPAPVKPIVQTKSAPAAAPKAATPAPAPAARPAPTSAERPITMTSAPALKPGRRSSARAPSQLPPPAPMVPTHAPDAAKASYSTMTERVIAPPPHVAAKKDPKLANNWKTTAAEALTDDEVKAMPDSEYMNDKQMAFFRHKLSILKQEIHNSAGETTEHLREDTVVVPDPADRATIEEEHALELRTRDRERKLLKKIEQSIARIDSGDYGYCDETGEPIGVGRLIARPTANLSLEAQQRRELKQKMFGD